MKLLDPVFELNPLNDLGQAVWPGDPPPFFLRSNHQPENDGQGGLPVQAALGFPGPVPDGGKDALDRVCGADVFPMLGREVVEGQQFVVVVD